MITAALLVLGLFQDPGARFGDYPEQDALSYRLTLTVDPRKRQLSGEVEYRFRAVQALESIRLDSVRPPASGSWHIAFRDPAGKTLDAKWHGDLVVVPLGGKVEAGSEVTFRAELQGQPPDGFYFKNNRYDEPLAFTVHYSIRARGWLPCEDNPADRAMFHVDLTVPAGEEAICSGVAEGEPQHDAEGRTVLHRQTASDIPPYMLAVIVGPYARVGEGGDPRLLPHLIYRRDVDEAKPALTHHAAWLHRMEETFGPFAYGSYTIAQCPTQWGGFEAPGNVQVAENLFESPDHGVSTLAHELVHMWFGDGVGYAEWREVWLSEGFASYFGPWLYAATGGPPLAAAMAEMRKGWLQAPEGRALTMRWDGFANPDQALNANTYPKGAWVLHMLRGELGDEAFFKALSAYYKKHVGHSVVTADFVADVGQSAGTDLGWFFAQWLDRPGCPMLRVQAKPDGIAVDQLQQGEPYRFRLRLRWNGADGKQEQVATIRDRNTVVPVTGAVADLVVDPEVELLFRKAP
jgi:aminopeptidase N